MREKRKSFLLVRQSPRKTRKTRSWESHWWRAVVLAGCDSSARTSGRSTSSRCSYIDRDVGYADTSGTSERSAGGWTSWTCDIRATVHGAVSTGHWKKHRTSSSMTGKRMRDHHCVCLLPSSACLIASSNILPEKIQKSSYSFLPLRYFSALYIIFFSPSATSFRPLIYSLFFLSLSLGRAKVLYNRYSRWTRRQDKEIEREQLSLSIPSKWHLYFFPAISRGMLIFTKLRDILAN